MGTSTHTGSFVPDSFHEPLGWQLTALCSAVSVFCLPVMFSGQPWKEVKPGRSVHFQFVGHSKPGRSHHALPREAGACGHGLLTTFPA